MWLFDLDGCLVDSFAATDVRPLAVEALSQARRSGATVVIWSAGGVDYARRVAERLGLAELVDGFYPKDRGSAGRWVLHEDFRGAAVTCVDDQPDGLPELVDAIAVFPYLGVDRHDRALEAVLRRLEGTMG